MPLTGLQSKRHRSSSMNRLPTRIAFNEWQSVGAVAVAVTLPPPHLSCCMLHAATGHAYPTPDPLACRDLDGALPCHIMGALILPPASLVSGLGASLSFPPFTLVSSA